jgi:hypothetical protein
MAANLVMTGTPRLADAHAPVRFTAKNGTIALTAGDGVYLHTDGTWRPIDKTVCTIATTSKWYGIVINGAAIGQEGVTAFGIGSKIWLTDTAQTPGSFWWVSATVGKFYDAAVAASDGPLPCIKFITANVAEVVRGGV